MPVRSPVALLSPRPLLATSRIALGKRLRVRGVPAILIGVAAIVLARGAGTALARADLPETLCEARAFWLAVRGEARPELRS